MSARSWHVRWKATHGAGRHPNREPLQANGGQPLVESSGGNRQNCRQQQNDGAKDEHRSSPYSDGQGDPHKGSQADEQRGTRLKQIRAKGLCLLPPRWSRHQDCHLGAHLWRICVSVASKQQAGSLDQRHTYNREIYHRGERRSPLLDAPIEWIPRGCGGNGEVEHSSIGGDEEDAPRHITGLRSRGGSRGHRRSRSGGRHDSACFRPWSSLEECFQKGMESGRVQQRVAMYCISTGCALPATPATPAGRGS